MLQKIYKHKHSIHYFSTLNYYHHSLCRMRTKTVTITHPTMRCKIIQLRPTDPPTALTTTQNSICVLYIYNPLSNLLLVNELISTKPDHQTSFLLTVTGIRYSIRMSRCTINWFVMNRIAILN